MTLGSNPPPKQQWCAQKPTSATLNSSPQTFEETRKRKFDDLARLLMPSKRSKPSTATLDKQNEEAVSSQSTPNNNSNVSLSGSNAGSDTSAMRKQRSWYGTWPRATKSGASTEVARQSILATKSASGSSSNLSRFESKTNESNAPTVVNSRPPSMYVGKSKGTSSITLDEDKAVDRSKSPSRKDMTGNQTAVKASPPQILNQSSTEQSTASSYLSYIPIIGSWAYSQPPPDQPAPDNPGDRHENSLPSPSEQPSRTILSDGEDASKGSDESTGSWWPWSSSNAGATTSSEAPATSIEESASISSTEEAAQMSSTPDNSSTSQGSGPTSRRWFSGFSLTSSDPVESKPKETQPLLNSVERTTSKRLGESEEGVPKFKDGTQPAPGSSWAFFSNKSSETGSQDTGRLAVVGDRSQNKPEPATIENKKKQPPESPETPSSGTSWKTPDPHYPTMQPHLLLPELRETYKLMEDPSIIQQITRLIGRSRQPPAEHVALAKDPPRIRRAIAIGVHGMLPPGLLNAFLGPATGTSKLFADHAAAAIHRWSRGRGYHCKVDTILLEFSGRVKERVEFLWKTLLCQIAAIQEADLIIFACHSQGVPVSIILAAKLIDLGVITGSTRIGVCAMAGTNVGPFLHLQTRLVRTTMGGTIGFELFDFADSESAVSKAYVESLKKVLRFGARVAYIGSVDDQLVSMESSTFTPVHHPHIFRAVFVDGRLHKPDFITKLVGFALKLRNMGVRDHGLIRELSVSLAGPLISGVGHSVVYDYPKVYDLAIQHTLETTSVEDVELKVNPYNTHLRADPYFLPFAIRGVLDEQLVQTELSDEATELLEQFDEWQPANSQLLDVKNRLRAIKSML